MSLEWRFVRGCDSVILLNILELKRMTHHVLLMPHLNLAKRPECRKEVADEREGGRGLLKQVPDAREQ